MADQKDEKKFEHLTPEQAEKAKKTVEKLSAIKAVRKMKNEDSEYDLLQETLQDIQAAHIVRDPNASPPVTQLVKELKEEIEHRYDDDEELKKLLLEAVPSARSVRQWLKRDGWEEAVWQRIRADKLFSPAKRSEVIQALHYRAKTKSDMAAKIYLTLSGDYVEKAEINDKTVDQFREISKVFYRKKSEE